jgi:uncharacterized protein
MTAVTAPQIRTGLPLGLSEAVHSLLPPTGSVEVQRDTPGREHAEHEHPTDETLLIIDGDITFWWRDAAGQRQEAGASPGDRLLLPAGTRHGSVAGDGGCLYIIALEHIA